jgi:hypothetical protein
MILPKNTLKIGTKPTIEFFMLVTGYKQHRDSLFRIKSGVAENKNYTFGPIFLT